jgi:hypothetical protein
VDPRPAPACGCNLLHNLGNRVLLPEWGKLGSGSGFCGVVPCRLDMATGLQDWPLRRRLPWFAGASHMLMWGLLLATPSGLSLLRQRLPNSPWRGPVSLFAALCTLWFLVVEGISIAAGPRGQSRSSSDAAAEPVVLVAAICLGILTAFRSHAWANLLVGILLAIVLTAIAKARHRQYPLAICGWIFAGVLGSVSHWPGDQGFELVFLLGGLATAVQGAFEVSAYYRELLDETKSWSITTEPFSRREKSVR